MDKVGFAPVPAGPKAHNCATFIEGIGIPATAPAKNKKAAWLFLQWVCGKEEQAEVLRTGSGTPGSAVGLCARRPRRQQQLSRRNGSRRPATSLKIARSGLPVIVPVTEFRDNIGVGLTNIVGGADPATELKKATAAFQPVLDKSNEA